MSQSLVSVVIPAYNAQAFIAQTIDSILAQTCRDIEVIVVDDGSTDRTRSIVQAYGSRVHYHYQNNSGGCAVPRNKGIVHSSGQFLCFMDADDLMVADRVAEQLDLLERHSDVGLVFSNYRNFSETGESPQSHFETCPVLLARMNGQPEIVLDDACTYLAQENFGIASSFMVRRALLPAEPCFESSLKACEDFHFYYRLARRTKVGVLFKVGMMRRLHDNNMSGNPARMLGEGIRSYSMLRECERNTPARKFLDERIAEFWSDLSRWNANRGHHLLAARQQLVALRTDRRFSSVLRFCRNIARVMLMAMGMHRPERE